ncbi:MAG: dTDP-4-dehydrorhamnose 3,5-epimerase, partial [Elusimicrobiota bacterium]
RKDPQGKLVRVVEGAIFDVVVDIRKGSPTFGRWISVELSGENFRQLWVPPDFAHGYCVLSERAHMEYKVTTFYDPATEFSLLWNDPALGIAWPFKEPALSKRDAAGKTLAQLSDNLPSFR